MTARLAAGALPALGIAGLAAVAGGFLALVAERTSPLALIGPPLLAGALLLVLRPKATLTLALVYVTIFEDDPQGFLGFTSNAFTSLPGIPLRPQELILLLAAAGIVVERAGSRRTFRTPEALTLPILLLVVATLAGAVNGWFAGAGAIELLNNMRALLTLALVPVMVVNVIDDERDLVRLLGLVLVLAAIKTAFGGTGWLLGAGRQIEGSVLTFYSALPNLLLLLTVLGVLAARLVKAELPAAAWWLAPLALAVLVLSFRRNFWIAVALGVALVVLVGVGARGRLLVVPAGLLVCLALWLGLTALSTSQSNSPVVQRAQSLAPSRLQASSQDRYRLDEQRNVRAEIADHPLLGIGLGVPWEARYPLAEVFPGGRLYTHTTVLWYWLKLGLAGLVAYLWLMVAAMRSGLLVWREAADPRVRAAGLAAAAGLLGLAVAETTGSFSGVSARTSLLIGVVLGWIAAARLVAKRAAERPTA